MPVTIKTSAMKYKNPDTGQYEGVDMIEEKAVRDIVADDYSPTSPYAVDAYCLYNGDYYRCTTAIQSGEAWNASHWTPTQVSDELVSIKGAVDSIGTNEVANESNVSGATASAALNTLSGAINSKAPIDSPTFTGTPKSITPTSGDNSTNIATTAFVKDAIDDAIEINALTINSTVPASVGTGTNLVITKSGNYLRLSGAITLNGSIAGKEVVLATVPELYRTQANPSFLAWATYNNTTGWYYFEYSNNGNIKTNIGSGTLTGTIFFPSCIIPFI